MKKYTDEELKQLAKEFVDELFKDCEVECPICTAVNCICNETCINCDYLLKK